MIIKKHALTKTAKMPEIPESCSKKIRCKWSLWTNFVPLLTLHQTIYVHFYIVLALFLPALLCIRLQVASNPSSLTPTDYCSTGAPSCFLAQCFLNMEAIHCK